MEAFIKRKRQSDECSATPHPASFDDEDSTEIKLAMLASLSDCHDTCLLLEALLASDGSVEEAHKYLQPKNCHRPRKRHASGGAVGYQSSLISFAESTNNETTSPKKLTKKGKTLHLYSPHDIAAHTPCSIIHNFLPTELANSLLRELLGEAPTYSRDTFKLFDNIVTSPHTFCFYVNDWDEAERQKTEFIYNGSNVQDIRRTTPEMAKASKVVENAVNDEISKRIASHYPEGKKLKFQSANPWTPNTSFVNCYDGGKESVGYHADQLTYLGPRAIIGSLSLGVAREFRIRKIVPRMTKYAPEDHNARKADDLRADIEGQIAIHLPHNSLLVMHAEMQEEWKHSIAPSQAIDPHPIAGNKRINITYRCYREPFHPKYTPRCRCNVPTVLRCVQKQEENRGKYMWMCHAGYTPTKEGYVNP